MAKKDVFLTLSSITYSGQSIGNEIRIEIEAMNKPLRPIDFILKKGKTLRLDRQIGIYTTDKTSFSIPLKFTLTEWDSVFDDVGEKKVDLKIDLNEFLVQKKTISVEVKEAGRLLVKPKAKFNLSFDIQVMEASHYVKEQEDGFVMVLMDKHSSTEDETQSLPAFLKVRLDKTVRGRDYFTIMEGWRRGETASVKKDENGNSYLAFGNPYTGSVFMQYLRSEMKLKVKGKFYKAIEDPREPWKNGFYDIEIADYPHEGGIDYLDRAPKAKVWFHIGHERSRLRDEKKFIHTGSATLGCITLTQHEKWGEVYEALIKSRLGDGKSVGILEVID